MKRYFFVDTTASVGGTVTITGQEHTHIAKVLRLKAGEEIVCLPNDGSTLNVTIDRVEKDKTLGRVTGVDYPPQEARKNVTVFVACLKGEKFEFLITKLTEIGVKRLVPFESEFTTAKLLHKKDRYDLIAKDACKQCRRTRTIEVGEPISFSALLNDLSEVADNGEVTLHYDKIIFASELEHSTHLSEVDLAGSENVAVVVGSEGGFSEREANELVLHGATSVSLGTRILRAETAGLVVPSIVQFLLGEF